MKATSSIFVTFVATTGIATAQPPPPPAVAPPPPEGQATASAEADGPVVSLTWSPVHLVLPLVELMGEYNVAPHMGAAVILGAGRITNDEVTPVSATAYEVGGQFNYYVMRRFSGLHVGLEALYVHLGDIEEDMTLTATGLAVGPYVGYKVQTSIGFAFIAQLGVSSIVVEAKNSNSMASDSDFSPLLNLNAGWSF